MQEQAGGDGCWRYMQILKVEKRDYLVPRYDLLVGNTLRRLIITFSEMQSNLTVNVYIIVI